MAERRKSALRFCNRCGPEIAKTPRGDQKWGVRDPNRTPRPAKVADTLDEAKVRRVLAHIDQNLDGELSVETLAELVGLSASCFARTFRKALGVTPHTYVLEARVERAKTLIRETDLPLVEVALAVGFSSQACLNVAFRRRVGMTPGRFRALDSRKAKDDAHDM